jgi:transcriptional regulator with XRE-family HTH domain
MESVPGWAGTASGGSVVLRRAVGARLRRCREAAGISREQAAFVIKASAPTISRMELGRMRFKERDVVDLLTHYYIVDPAEHAEFLELVRQANTDGWWRSYRDVMPVWFETYLSMEQDGSQIRTYAVQFLPELLQSDDYARAVVSTGEGDPSEIERRMELSRQRRARLTGPGGPRLWAVLDEAVLRRAVTDQDLRRRQLGHLVDLAALPNVSLQIARFDRRAALAIGGAFSILRFPTGDLGDVVYLEQLDSARYVDKPADVEKYQSAWNRMCATIESPRTSIQIIEGMRSE